MRSLGLYLLSIDAEDAQPYAQALPGPFLSHQRKTYFALELLELLVLLRPILLNLLCSFAPCVLELLDSVWEVSIARLRWKGLVQLDSRRDAVLIDGVAHARKNRVSTYIASPSGRP